MNPTAGKITVLVFGLLVVLLFTRLYVFGFVHAGVRGPPEPVFLAQVSRIAVRVYLAEIAAFVALAVLLFRSRK